MHHLFIYKEFRLEYKIMGSGNKPLVAFHGFGQTANVYEALLPSLGKDFIIYSFNIFFHGKSYFPIERIAKKSLKKEEWAEIFEAFTKEKKIGKFSLIGYSLGGKLALNLIEGLAERIEHLTLIAPDGLKIYPLTYVSTRSKLLQKFFLRVIENPDTVFKIMNLMKSMGLMDAKAVEFYIFQISEKWRRQLTYDVWMTMKYMNPDLKKIVRLINQHRIKTIMIYGKYDTVIKAYLIKKFGNKLNDRQIIEVNAGHNLLTEKLNGALEKIIF